MTGVFPVADDPVAPSYPPAPESSAFLALVQSVTGASQYLIEITAYKGGEARSGGLWTVAEGPMSAVPGGVGVDVGEIEVLLGDRSWMGDASDPARANKFYEGRVKVPLLMERTMPLLPEEDRRVQRQFGEIEIANGDGELDALVRSYAVDGRQVRVLFGPAEELS